MKELYVKEYSAALIDVVEDFLDMKSIRIDNDEKSEDSDEAVIYGSDYDYIMEQFIVCLDEMARNAKDCNVINTTDWPMKNTGINFISGGNVNG